jgi:nucleoside-diphosphate-sugar epimerase
MRTIKSALVTGPTGAIGTALCRLLAEKKIRVYAVIRPGSKRAAHLRGITGVTLVECDAAELSQLSGIEADAFFHLAWAKTTGQGRNDMPAQIRNIQYTIDAVHAAHALGCKVFVGAGSQAEYGRVNHALTPETPCFPENGYGMAKLCAGQMSRTECEKLGIDHIWPRILSVYGPFDGENAMIPQVIRKLLAGETPALTAGEQIWDYLYAGDAAEALYRLALMGKTGEIYPLGSGHARPLRAYIEALRDAIDPSLPLGFGEVPYGSKQVMHLEADITALQTDIGFEPTTGFEDGIRKTVEWVREQHG